jgi:hypothetical protein
VGARLLDDGETRTGLRSFENQRLFDREEFYMHQMWRVARQEIDGTGAPVAVFALDLRTGLSLTVRQFRKVSVKRGTIVIVAGVNVEHRAIDHRYQ